MSASPSKRGRTAAADDDLVKTSLRIPRTIWRRARLYAVDTETDLQVIVAEAIDAYLDAAKARKPQPRRRLAR